MVACFRRCGPESATPTRQQSFRRQPLPNNSTGGGASSVPATPIRAPDPEKVRKNRQDRSVDRRKRLSHVGSQGLASLWGRRFRLPTDFFSASAEGLPDARNPLPTQRVPRSRLGLPYSPLHPPYLTGGFGAGAGGGAG